MDRRQVARTANLARMKLSDEELDTFADQLTGLLDYIAILNEVDTEDVEPMAHAVDLSNVLRDDAFRPSLPREAALSNAPKTDGAYFLVPPILEEN